MSDSNKKYFPSSICSTTYYHKPLQRIVSICTAVNYLCGAMTSTVEQNVIRVGDVLEEEGLAWYGIAG